MTLNSFKKVYDDARIDTIVIVDDASDIDVYTRLKEECDKLSKLSFIEMLQIRTVMQINS